MVKVVACLFQEQIQNKMNEEMQNNNSAAAVLDMLPNHNELAGDGQFLKEPGS